MMLRSAGPKYTYKLMDFNTVFVLQLILSIIYIYLYKSFSSLLLGFNIDHPGNHGPGSYSTTFDPRF